MIYTMCMNTKDFDTWNRLKIKLDKANVKPPDVKEGDIWWVFLGENIGKEISGKGNTFTRPMLIFKKINEITFSCIPLTTSEKVFNIWKYPLSIMDKKSYLCFDQIKTIDYRRLKIKVRELKKEEFVSLRDYFIDIYKRADPLAGVGHRDLRSDASQVLSHSLIKSISRKHTMSNINNHDFNTEAVEMHKKYQGKLGVVSKVPLSTREDLSRAYTPGVAEVCREIARDTTLAKKMTLKGNTVAIISDGSAILGLGNLGAFAAIPVMEGKAVILKEFAGVDAFPICLDTQDTDEIIKAVKQIAPVFGAINLEDIAAPRCFEIEERLRRELSIPIMHDDQWGTATVVLAGVINAMKLCNLTKENIKVIVNGVGSAGVAVSRLLFAYGISNILFCDSQGIIHREREGLTKEKKELLEKSKAESFEGALVDAMKGRHLFIGLSKANTVSKEMVRSMEVNPIIFSLANPTPEIMPEEANEAGAFIVATGRSDYPNQLNNSLIFPGLFKGMLQYDIPQFNESIFMRAALALANHVKGVSPTNILPTMFDEELVGVISESVK